MVCDFRLEQAPANVVKVDFGVVPQSTFVRAATVIVLDTVGVKSLDLAIIFCYDKFHKDLSLWREQQPLELLGVLKLLKSL